MDGCTINIADFRCRAITRSASIPRRLHGFEIVRPNEGSKEREAEILQEAVMQEDPTVYDIGIAREVQRLRHRAVFRPISILRKAKVLRFRAEAPTPVRIRLEERRAAEAWSGRPDGPYDFPPAA